jgi:hypothetical protein
MCPDALCLDRPWRHSVDVNAVLGQFQRHIADEAMDAGFCG